MIRLCVCSNAGQDTLHGKGLRVLNAMKKAKAVAKAAPSGKKKKGTEAGESKATHARCSVCGNIHTL